MNVRLLVAATSFIMLTAGCVGSQAAPRQAPDDAAPAPPPKFTDDTGAIVGIVSDEEGVGLEGVEVGLVELQVSTQTDLGGAFTLSEIAPGGYSLVAQKLGYESSARKITVEAGTIAEAHLQLLALPVEEAYHATKIENGNVQCSVRAYPGVPTGGTGGLPPWVTGVAVCGLVSLPGFAPDRFLINYEWPENTQEVLLEMEWKSTQALGRGLSVVLEHQGHPNDAKYTFGRDTGPSPLIVDVNETKMLNVSETSGIECLESKCKVYTRVFAEANTTDMGFPVPPPDLPVLGRPPNKIDAGFTLDQRFTQYMTTFHFQTKPAGFTALADR